jgi:hypothetical protein
MNKKFAVHSKNFKLLTAFKEECEEIGWEYDSIFNKFTLANFGHDRDLLFETEWRISPSKIGVMFSLSAYVPSDVDIYTLPKDWDIAIDAAKSTFALSKNLQVQLNESYHADVKFTTNTVVIVKKDSGNLSLSFEQIKKVYDAINTKPISIRYKKKDLKSGMLLQDTRGQLGLVLLQSEDGDVIASDGSDAKKRMWKPLDVFNKDLECLGSNNAIVKVWSAQKVDNEGRAGFKPEFRNLLWEEGQLDPISIDLGLSWPIVITADRKNIQVGCQTFSAEVIKELYQATIK